MSLAQGDIIGQKISDGSDPLGCWVYTKYTSKGNRIATVVAAYQPCKPSKDLFHANLLQHEYYVSQLGPFLT